MRWEETQINKWENPEYLLSLLPVHVVWNIDDSTCTAGSDSLIDVFNKSAAQRSFAQH